MDLTQIRYFLALARTLNFTRAAEACNVTQPALTKSVQRLEHELGGPLLLRERSHTQLTPLGTAMRPLLQRTLEAAEAARDAAAGFRTHDVARLRLGLGTWVEPGLVAPLIREVARRIPDLELTIRHGAPAALNTWLLSSEIEVTLTTGGERLTERANRWPVFSDPIVALIPGGHDLDRPGPLPIEALHGHALAGPCDSGEPPGAEVEALYRTLPVRHRGETPAQMDAMVQAGCGLALSTARRALPPGTLRRPLDPPRQHDVVVATLAGRPCSRAVDAFVKLARARGWDD